MPFDRATIQSAASRLVQAGVYVGTSSWKYEGWFDQLYTPARYEYRGKFAESRFRKNCLAEYAEVFKTVCVDAACYTFPGTQYLEGMVNLTPFNSSNQGIRCYSRHRRCIPCAMAISTNLSPGRCAPNRRRKGCSLPCRAVRWQTRPSRR